MKDYEKIALMGGIGGLAMLILGIILWWQTIVKFFFTIIVPAVFLLGIIYLIWRKHQ